MAKKPKTPPPPPVRTFQTVDVLDVPKFFWSESDIAEAKAALAAADKDPEKAIIWFSDPGNKKMALRQSNRMRHFLDKRGAQDKYHLRQYGGTVYLWSNKP